MKKGPLTNKEKSYLDKYQHLEVDHLAKKLDRSTRCVSMYLGLTGTREVKIDPSTRKDPYLDNLFAKKESHGVVVMTEAASMYLDERRTKKVDKIDPSFIFRCKDKK